MGPDDLARQEFRRYLNRFIHLFPTFDTMSGVYRTRYNQCDSISIVRPLLAWLDERHVNLHSVRTAWEAVAGLLKLERQPPPVYKGQYDPRVLVHALETMHR